MYARVKRNLLGSKTNKFMKKNKQEPIKTDGSEQVVVSGGKFYEFVKRSFDIFASFIFLILFSWLILILLFIKFCEDGHNPVYTSLRVGKNGKIIKFHKIRSMKPGAEALKEEMIEQGMNEASGPVFKVKDDPRITRFGKFLRRSSLDELLQVWDIFVGRMSIVGPRPPIPEEVERYNDFHKQRLLVKGGLVCLWQITKNRHDIDFDDWVRLDLEYIRNRSVGYDLKIIFKAIWFVLTDHSGE